MKKSFSRELIRNAVSILLAAGCFTAGIARAEIQANALFSDNAVLQRGMTVPVWGTGDDGEKVTVTVAGQTAHTVVRDGKWRVNLAPLSAGGPYTMTIAGGHNIITVHNVLVGEVWLCSGQSNMEKQMSPRPPQPDINNWQAEVARANYPRIRLINVATKYTGTPQENFSGAWKICTPETAGAFSAVAYFFGRDLQEHTNVPIGLLTSYLGGTKIQSWTPLCAYEQTPELAPQLGWIQMKKKVYRRDKALYVPEAAAWLPKAQAALAAGREVPDPPQSPDPIDPFARNQQDPTALFNGMINPLIPYAIRGVVWYQGESDVGDNTVSYYVRLKALINTWRGLWGQGTFPFFIVQIAPYERYGPGAEQLVWEAEERATAELPDAGLASTMDIGLLNNIHPSDKQDVGKRLMLLAMARVYGDTNLVYSGPTFASLTVDGTRIIVHFHHVGSGLASRDGKPLNLFEIAGVDGKFIPATAVIQDSDVVVQSSQVRHPTAVRFAWTNHAIPNLMNREGLPALPFQKEESGGGEGANPSAP